MGNHVKIAGSIGDDFLGKLLLKQMAALNIETSDVDCIGGEDTASTIILLQKGEDRRFISALGVTERFTGASLKKELLPKNGVVVIGGYLKLFNWDDISLIDFLKIAKERGNKTILNISFLKNSDVDPKRCLKILPFVDVFVPNENEAEIITDKKDIYSQSSILLSAGAGLIVITRGTNGLFAEDIENIIEMESIPVKTVDPSGCGDCFTAGIAAGLSNEFDTIDALKYGTAAGALSASQIGCTTGITEHALIKTFINNNPINYKITRKEEK